MNETLEQIAEVCWEDAERHINIWASDREEMVRAEFARRLVAELGAQEPVAYFDVGFNGYIDLGSDLEDEQVRRLGAGKHNLYTAPIPATCPVCTQMIDDAAKAGRVVDARWQPISKRANDKPNDAGEVPGYLCLFDADKKPECGFRYMVANGAWLNKSGKDWGITHWMPLPAAPEYKP